MRAVLLSILVLSSLSFVVSARAAEAVAKEQTEVFETEEGTKVIATLKEGIMVDLGDAGAAGVRCWRDPARADLSVPQR